MLLQRAAGAPADGCLGPQTMTAVARADSGKLLRHMAALRMVRYTETTGWAIYGAGWTERVMDVLMRAVAV